MPDYYTQEDLISFLSQTAMGKSVRLGVVGNPIAHSKSPQMQQAALDALGIKVSYVRLMAGTEEGAFEQLIRDLQRLGFIGANVTVPFKKRAYAMADEADELSRLSEAANTLVWKDGRLCAHNTDGPGFSRAIEEFSGRKLSELRIVLLGACGGAGSALACQCALSRCPCLTLVNRPKPQMEELASKLRTVLPANAVRTEPFGSPTLQNAVEQADLIVNATSLGLTQSDAMPLPPAWLRAEQFVYDIVTHTTPLAQAARARGCRASNGLGMLLWQGALAFERWFGQLPPLTPMRLALSSEPMKS